MKPLYIIDEYRKRLMDLQKCCIKSGVEIQSNSTLERLLQKQFFEIAFVGEFTAGKSTLINALLGENILPTRLEPTTAKITKIRYSEKPAVMLRYRDSTTKELTYSPNILQQLVAANPEEIEQISTIEVGYPAEFLKEGFVLVDTPGTNDSNADRVKITYELLPEVDAVVYVTIHPVTESNLECFNTHILGNHLEQVIIVLNKRDMFVDVLEKVSNDVERNFSKYCGKNVSVPVISAVDYLEGIILENEDMVLNSNMSEFLSQLDEYLKGSAKYDALEKKYKIYYEILKSQTLEIIATQAASLVMPDEVFENKKKNLQINLNGCKQETEKIKEDATAAIDKIICDMNESLDKINNGLVDQIALVIDQHQGDVRVTLRNIELMVRREYDNWRMRNEQNLNREINLLVENIKKKLGKVALQIETAMADFRSEALSQYTSSIQDKKMLGFITDISSMRTSISLASGVGAVVLTALAGVTAGISMILAPMAMIFAEKKRKEYVAAIKNETMVMMRQDASQIKRKVLDNLYLTNEQLNSEIDKVLIQHTENINKKLNEIEIERNKMAQDISLRIKELMKTKESIEAL
ncbi:MAG: dynamin family protein [Clostridiales bacterium]